MHWIAGLALGLVGVGIAGGIYKVATIKKGMGGGGVYAVDIDSIVERADQADETQELIYDLSVSTTLE